MFSYWCSEAQQAQRWKRRNQNREGEKNIFMWHTAQDDSEIHLERSRSISRINVLLLKTRLFVIDLGYSTEYQYIWNETWPDV